MFAKAAALLLLVNISSSLCSVIPKEEAKDVQPSPRAILSNCDSIFDTVCMKLSFISFLERVSQPGEYNLLPGVAFVKQHQDEDSNEKLQEISRSFPNSRDEQVDALLSYKIASFLENHSLKFKLIDDETARDLKSFDNEVDPSDEARGKKKKKLKLVALAIGLVGLIKKAIASVFILGSFFLAKKAILLSIAAIIGVIIVGLKGDIAKSGLGGLGGGKKEEHHGSGWSSGGGNGGGAWSSAGGGGDYSSHGGYARSIDIRLPAHLAAKE